MPKPDKSNVQQKIKRYWVSWCNYGKIFGPTNNPPNENILGWWKCACIKDGAILCALILATNESEAKSIITTEWPDTKFAMVSDWKNVSEVSDHYVPADRFILSDWMQKRIL